MPRNNHPCRKIGPLTVAQRYNKVKKFLEKRKKRKFNKTILYMGRKKVSDTKQRINGRFIKTSDKKSLPKKNPCINMQVDPNREMKKEGSSKDSKYL